MINWNKGRRKGNRGEESSLNEKRKIIRQKLIMLGEKGVQEKKKNLPIQ